MRPVRTTAAAIAVSLAAGVVSAAVASSAAATPTATGASVSSQLRAQSVAALGRLEAHAASPAAQARTVVAAPVAKNSIFDAVGDALFPQGDITGGGVLQNSVGTGFSVSVETPANPLVDSTWQGGGAVVVWFLDTNDDGQYDNQIIAGLSTTSNTLISLLTDSTGKTVLCGGFASYIAHVGYRATIHAGCLPHLTKVRFAVGMIYDDPADMNPPVDLAPDQGLSAPIAVQAPVHGTGYWMLDGQGHVYPFGDAEGFAGAVPNATSMAPVHDGTGYWVVDRAGHVFTYGTAPFHGGTPALRGGEFISSISATTSGGGYWLFTNQGRVFAFGSAGFFGDMSAAHLNGPIVASVATASGKGYYLVGSDGGIFSFGDAKFHGSTGGIHLNKPIVGISPTADGKGYWLVGSDGGVFAFTAPFRGSMGGDQAQPARRRPGRLRRRLSDGGLRWRHLRLLEQAVLRQPGRSPTPGADHRPGRIQFLTVARNARS